MFLIVCVIVVDVVSVVVIVDVASVVSGVVAVALAANCCLLFVNVFLIVVGCL